MDYSAKGPTVPVPLKCSACGHEWEDPYPAENLFTDWSPNAYGWKSVPDGSVETGSYHSFFVSRKCPSCRVDNCDLVSVSLLRSMSAKVHRVENKRLREKFLGERK